MEKYPEIAKKARLKVLDLIYKAGTSHIGSNFSSIDLLTVLFDRLDLDQDKFILSAGWKAASLYYFLWTKGRITKKELDSYCKKGSKFIGLAEPIHKDIPFAGGSMGLGFPAVVGFALAKKMKGEPGMIYCMMSDGEMQIGTTWEAAMIASHWKLDNLCVIVDYNKFSAMGLTNQTLNIEPLHLKWATFGWTSVTINGHSYFQTKLYLDGLPFKKDVPSIIIANTIKGKGVSWMESNNLWHYAKIQKDDYKKAKAELNA